MNTVKQSKENALAQLKRSSAIGGCMNRNKKELLKIQETAKEIRQLTDELIIDLLEIDLNEEGER